MSYQAEKNVANVFKIGGIFAGPLLFILFLWLPTPADMSAQAHNMAAIVIWMAVWWITEAIPIPVTSLLPLVLIPMLGIMGAAEVSPNYMNQLVFLFLGGFLLASAIVKWNFHKRIALLTIRIIGSSPKRLILGFMIATGFLSMWISNTATVMMMLPIAMAVVGSLSTRARYKGELLTEDSLLVHENFGLALMLGIAYAASISGIGTKIGTPPNGVLIGQLSRLYGDAAPEISFAAWMAVGVPVVLLMLPLTWLVVCYITPSKRLGDFTFEFKGSSIVKKELKALGPMSHGEKKVAMVFTITALLWIFRSPIDLGSFTIPGWAQLFSNPGYLSDATVAVGMGTLLFVIPVSFRGFSLGRPMQDNFVLDWKTAQKGVPWGILLLFGGGFALAHGFSASGLSAWIGSRLQFLGDVPLAVMVVAICLLMTFLTEVTSNTATTTLMIPVLAVLAVNLNQHPLLLMIPATMSASCAFMLPVATPPNAIVFGSSWVTVSKMCKTGIILNFVGAAVITAVTLYIVASMFGIQLGVLPDWAVTK